MTTLEEVFLKIGKVLFLDFSVHCKADASLFTQYTVGTDVQLMPASGD